MTFSISIDNNLVKVRPNISVLQACELEGIIIPRFCYHERLSIAGNCRMCLVEIEKMPKLQASCAVPVSPNMVIKTNSPAVKKAREGVLEFILINHPLDCPVCDQGGECDLQDQSLTYGSDRNRFKEKKLAVRDKNFGPLIKTVMTRCINCTRCIRFANEIVGIPELGTSGRGSTIVISTYIKKLFASELSGNVIDLCPVGALTSKPYAFLSRPWELKSTESIDLFDSIHSNIRIDTRGYEIMRILPRLNESINDEWISDKARFSFDGLTKQRLINPLEKKADGSFEAISWNDAIKTISRNLKAAKNLGFHLGNFCDLESLALIKKLSLYFRGAVINKQTKRFVDFDWQLFYKFNTFLNNISKSNVCLLIGVNPKIEGVLLNYHLRKRYLLGNFVVAYIGSQLNLSFPSIHIGNSMGKVLAVVEGKHSVCKILRNYNNPCVIVGKSFTNNLKPYNFNLLFKLLQLNTHVLSNQWNGLNFYNSGSSDFSISDLNLNYGKKYKEKSFDCVYILEDSKPLDSKICSKFVVFQGHHGCANVQKANIVLPTVCFTEKTSKHVSCEGRYQLSESVTFPLGEAKESITILHALLNSLQIYSRKFETLISKPLYNLIPPIEYSINLTQSTYFKGSFYSNQCILVDNFYISSSCYDNFYKTDIVSELSINMSRCSKQLLNKKPFKS